jgi:hypothetical protein
MRKLPPPQLRPSRVASADPEDGLVGVRTPRTELSEDRVAPALELRPDGVTTHERELRLDGVVLPPVSGRPRPAVVEPLAPARYKVQFTASTELHDKLERLRALMRSSVPDGDLAAIIEEAVTEKLERLEAQRFARTRAPRKVLSGSDTCPRTRQIPAAVRRAVYERDGGRCRYVDEHGRRCTARERLEFHHRHPFGHGGDHSVDGVSLLCRAHNRYLAEIDYGRKAIALHRGSKSRRFGPTPESSSSRRRLRRRKGPAGVVRAAVPAFHACSVCIWCMHSLS